MYFVNKPTREHATELMHEYSAQIEENKCNNQEEKRTRREREMDDVKANNDLMSELNNIQAEKKQSTIAQVNTDVSRIRQERDLQKESDHVFSMA